MAPVLRSADSALTSSISWQPFNLDALGLVTLLGADEVAQALGALNNNVLTDYLPVFGSFKVASNQIATVQPGFSLYNLTDGIWTSELAPWFTRWLNANLRDNFTILDWKVEKEARHRSKDSWFAALAGLFINGGLLALACVQRDNWGLANVVSMVVSVFVRKCICFDYRRTIDQRGQKFNDDCANSGSAAAELKKLIIVLPHGMLAIGYLPCGILPTLLDLKGKPLRWTTLFSQVRNALLFNCTGSQKSDEHPLVEWQPFWQQFKLWMLRALG